VTGKQCGKDWRCTESWPNLAAGVPVLAVTVPIKDYKHGFRKSACISPRVWEQVQQNTGKCPITKKLHTTKRMNLRRIGVATGSKGRALVEHAGGSKGDELADVLELFQHHIVIFPDTCPSDCPVPLLQRKHDMGLQKRDMGALDIKKMKGVENSTGARACVVLCKLAASAAAATASRKLHCPTAAVYSPFSIVSLIVGWI